MGRDWTQCHGGIGRKVQVKILQEQDDDENCKQDHFWTFSVSNQARKPQQLKVALWRLQELPNEVDRKEGFLWLPYHWPGTYYYLSLLFYYYMLPKLLWQPPPSLLRLQKAKLLLTLRN